MSSPRTHLLYVNTYGIDLLGIKINSLYLTFTKRIYFCEQLVA